MGSESNRNVGWTRRLRVALNVPLILIIVTVLLPVIAIVLLYWLFATVLLNVLWWVAWCIRGRDILFVYSDSPNWHDYIEDQVIPKIEDRAILLNWSDRRHWLGKFSLPSLVFRHFGGATQYNPMAVHFRPFRRHRTFRFWQAFKDQKHGKNAALTQLEAEFFRCINLIPRTVERNDQAPEKT